MNLANNLLNILKLPLYIKILFVIVIVSVNQQTVLYFLRTENHENKIKAP